MVVNRIKCAIIPGPFYKKCTNSKPLKIKGTYDKLEFENKQYNFNNLWVNEEAV